MTNRPDWHNYFMSIASVVATRATCKRKQVGAVIVRDRVLLSTGYNGSVRGLPHCTDVGCVMEDGHCITTVHAEANAIIQAAKNGVGIDGATIYTTASPCWPCLKLILNSGIQCVVYGESYRLDPKVVSTMEKLALEFFHVPEIDTSAETPKEGHLWHPFGDSLITSCARCGAMIDKMLIKSPEHLLKLCQSPCTPSTLTSIINKVFP